VKYVYTKKSNNYEVSERRYGSARKLPALYECWRYVVSRIVLDEEEKRKRRAVEVMVIAEVLQGQAQGQAQAQA
jgi:hypothetical protein